MNTRQWVVRTATLFNAANILHLEHCPPSWGTPWSERIMADAIKAEISDSPPRTVAFTALKTMYGGAMRPMGRRELKHLSDWNDGRPGTELNFKLYRQATNKTAAISAGSFEFDLRVMPI